MEGVEKAKSWLRFFKTLCEWRTAHSRECSLCLADILFVTLRFSQLRLQCHMC